MKINFNLKHSLVMLLACSVVGFLISITTPLNFLQAFGGALFAVLLNGAIASMKDDEDG